MEKSMSKRKSSFNTSCVSKISCFSASNPKPVRTSVYHQTNKTEGGLCKLKVSAQKIYDNVKKMKQKISPGGQFTNFISGIFTSGDPKKIRESYLNEGCADVVKSKYKRTSTCPSASSLARSKPMRNILCSGKEKSMSKRKSSLNTSCVSKISRFSASNSKPVRTSKTAEGDLCKLKVSAQKIYDNVKKMKQKISPGGQFTNFISGIFTSGDPKKIRESYLNEGCADVVKSKYKRTSTCPSASSLTRPCLSKSSPKSRHKRDTRMKKRVRSCHLDVQVDENCHKTNSRQPKLPHVDHNKNDVITNSRQPKLPHVDHKRNDAMTTNSKELKLPHGDRGRNGVIRSCEDYKNYEFVLDFLRTRMKIFEDDCSIDWSSDLAEIERLSSFKN